MKLKTYKCVICGKEEELTTPKEEMEKELNENFPSGWTPEDCDIVCDDCYNKAEITRAMAYDRT